MKNAENEQSTSSQQKKVVNSSDSDFDEAVDRVYQKYGSDLAAFVRDVQKELQKKADPNRRAACGTFF